MTTGLTRRCAAIVVAAVLAGGSGACGDSNADPVAVSVDVVETDLTSPPYQVVTVGRSLVATTISRSRGDPVIYSTDGGRTWAASELPTQAGIDPAWFADAISSVRLVAAGGIVLLMGGETARHPRGLRTPPLLWASSDGGRTFSAGTGVTDGGASGRVSSAVTANGGLIAMGEASWRARRAGYEPTVWMSSDRGRSWRRHRPVGADAGFSEAAVVSGGALMAAPWREGSVLRSTDGGRRWTSVALGSPGQAGPVDLRTVGSLVFARNETMTMVSADDGASWTTLGEPPAPAQEILNVHGAVDVFDVEGETYLGVASASDDADEVGEQRLVRSPNGGRSWQVIDTTAKPACRLELGGPGYGLPARVGRALVAVWQCSSVSQDQNHRLIYSTDDGRSWRRLGPTRPPIRYVTGRLLVSEGRALIFGSPSESGEGGAWLLARVRPSR